jgi:trypsin
MLWVQSLSLFLVSSAGVLAVTEQSTPSIATSSSESPLETSIRIVGGHEVASSAHYPFVVEIEHQDNLCGGTLFNSRQILTAAHCVKDAKHASEVLLRLGSRHRGQGRTSVAARIRIHPKYRLNPVGYDIAILDLKRPTSLMPADLPTNGTRVLLGQKVVDLGWGQTDLAINQVSNVLRHIAVVVSDMPQCKRAYQDLSYFRHLSEEFNFCTSSSRGGTAGGDSGGPALKYGSNTIVGIIKGGLRSRPDYYVLVQRHLDWIRAHRI